MQNRIWYTAPDDNPDEFYSYLSKFDLDCNCRWIAEQAAEDFFDNHDDYQSSWPVTIALHEYEGGPAIDRYSVDIVPTPDFIAWSA